MTLPIGFRATAAPVSTPRRDEKAENSSVAEDARASEDAPSVTVTLSQYARDRMEAMKKAVQTLKAQNSQANEQRKAAARARIDDIKKRIELLKKLAIGLSPKAAKAMLAQIHQLAHELSQAAGELKGNGSSAGGEAGIGAGRAGADASSGEADEAGAESSGSEASGSEAAGEAVAGADVSPDVAPSNAEAAGQTEADTDEARAGEPEGTQGRDDAAVADARAAEAKATAPQSSALSGANQKEEDSQRIRDAVRQLRQLLALVRSQLPSDEESRRTLRQVESSLRDSEKAAQDIQAGAEAGPAPAVSGEAASAPAGGLSITV